MTADQAVMAVTVFGIGFISGMVASQEKAAVELMPCPVAEGKQIIHRTKDVCTYVNAPKHQGRVFHKL